MSEANLHTDCPHCQTANPVAYNFCRSCGTLLRQGCPRCQMAVQAEDDFCGGCGLALTPRAQFAWASRVQGELTLPRPPVRRASAPLPATPQLPAPLPRPPDPAPVSAQPEPSPTANPIDRFLPKELAAKLDAARSSGAMVGERRVVTMLFCDVKGSTAAAEQLDPEEWTEIINGAFEHMIKPVYQYEGTVARLMGDAILAFFGAPIAHEDDPQRAVLAGLEIIAGFQRYQEETFAKHGLRISARVGINTGLVVVGAVGSDLRMEYTAMGDAINLAARMEQTAEPGTVQIAEDTYRLIEPIFDFENLGGVAVKGKTEPVPAYRVLGRKQAPGRLRGFGGVSASLVGRQMERETITGAAALLAAGSGSVVWIEGVAGLGKSRLVDELKQSWHATQANDQPTAGSSWLETVSYSYETGQPYSLIQRLFRRLAGATSNDSPAELQAKLDRWMSKLPSELAGQAGLVLSALFSTSREPHLSGEAFKRELFEYASALCRHLTSLAPTVLVLDDLHWTDSASVALVQHLLPLCAEVPLLFLCASRPEAESPAAAIKTAAGEKWPDRFVEIQLHPLNEAESSDLVDRLLRIADIPATLQATIQEKAQGNPFFVEEVVRTLLESGLVGETPDGNCWLGDAAVHIEIPDNIQSLITARIDRLPEETKRVLQLAALIGRTFYYRILATILAAQEGGQENELLLPSESHSLAAHLATLEKVDMVHEAVRLPELQYAFRHSLTQETAYATMLLKQRRLFHQRVGEVMEHLFADGLEEHAGLLAYHFFQAREHGKAFTYFRMAGDVAFRLNASVEAIGHYRQAIACTQFLELASPELIHVYERKGRAHEILFQYDEALATYDDLLALTEARQDKAIYLAVFLARTVVHATFTPRFDVELGIQYAEKALALALELDDKKAQARIYWAKMLVAGFIQVKFEEAVRLGRLALAVAKEGEHTEILPFILNDLGRMLGFDGQPQEGLVLIREAGPLFEQTHNLPMVADNWNALSLISAYAGEFDISLKAAEECMAISRRIDNPWGIRDGLWRRATIYGELGQFGLAIADFETLQIGVWAKDAFLTLVSGMFALPIYLHLGELERSKRLGDELQPNMDLSGPLFGQPVRGLLALLEIELGNLERADTYLEVSHHDPSTPFASVYNLYLVVGEMELALAQNDRERALEWSDRAEHYFSMGSAGFLKTRCALLRGRILLLYPDRRTDALATLRQARALAIQLENRENLWQIDCLLAEECGNAAESLSLLAEALEVVVWIAENTGNLALSRTFLQRPAVQVLLTHPQIDRFQTPALADRLGRFGHPE